MDVRTILLLSAVALASGCATEARRDMAEDKAEMHQQPLELKGASGAPDATIDVDGKVTIGKDVLPITEEQRAAVLRYRTASLATADIAFDSASHLTKYAIPRFLFGSVFHGFDGASRGIEADAEKIPHSPAFCDALANLRQAQDAMVAKVDRMQPYARFTESDVLDCRAGRPYGHSM